MKIAPSILSADFANLQRDIQLLEDKVDYIHVDVMDGQFVPNITIGPNVVSAISKITDKPLDCHLMIVNPENYIDAFVKAGADIISVHVESTPHIHRALQMIRQANVKAGVVINPGTPVSMIEHVLDLADLVLVMTVNPGFGGQKFIGNALEKVSELAQLKKTNDYHYEIEVDGGVDNQTLPLCKKAGAEVFVAGSYVYGANDSLAQVAKLRAAGNE